VAVHRSLRRFFDPLVVMSRARGELPFEDDGIDGAGFEGTVDFEFTGDGGGCWHYSMTKTGLCFARGRSASPRATLVMSPQTFVDLLAGKAAYSTALMTGRVRIRGDGHAGMILGAMVTRFRALGEMRGWRGRAGRLYRRFVIGS
jgi:SCP-2 sterol transfer family protein